MMIRKAFLVFSLLLTTSLLLSLSGAAIGGSEPPAAEPPNPAAEGNGGGGHRYKSGHLEPRDPHTKGHQWGSSPPPPPVRQRNQLTYRALNPERPAYPRPGCKNVYGCRG